MIMAASNQTSSQNMENTINGTNSSSASHSSNLSAQSQPDKRWIFSQESIENSPSRKDGLSGEQELAKRQEAALFISDLGEELKVNQLCINTAIIYMHRFFMINSFKKFHRYVRMVAAACLFLACKIEEHPRRLSDLISSIQRLFRKSNETVSLTREEYKRYEEEIVKLESCVLQTLGFDVLINHAHTFIIKTCQMIKAPRDLAEAAYFTATNSLILTNFCVRFSSEKIACFCIFLACKGTDLIIPTSTEGLQWYQYVKHDIVEQELEDISKDYLAIYQKCSPMVQKKIGKPKSAEHQVQNPHYKQAQVKKPYHSQMNPHHEMHQQHAGQNVNTSQIYQQKQMHPSIHKTAQSSNGSHQNHPKHIHQAHPNRSQQSSSNLNKSLPINQPSHKPSSTSQTPIKHPSSSNLNNPNKINGAPNIKNELIDKNMFNSTKKPSIPPPPMPPGSVKTSPSSSHTSSGSSNFSSSAPTASMKRANDELNNNLTTAPNKIPKYVVDQKSAS